MIITVPPEAFASGVLNKEYHERLLLDIDTVTATAGIPPQYLWARMSDYGNSEDLDWVRNFKHHGDDGLAILQNKGPVAVPDRMMAMTGAFLRNYIDARVMSVQDVLSHLKNDNMPHPTVLLIPNFCLGTKDGGHIAPWEVSSLLGLLYSRLSRNLRTVVYIGSLDAVEKAYGESFRELFDSHYSFS